MAFQASIIDAHDNLVRIPRMKHWEINGWYARSNKEFGERSPREYLRGKTGMNALELVSTHYQVWGSQAMKRIDLSEMNVEQLVERFAAVALEQDDAILMHDNAKFTRLFWQMEAVEEELKARNGDQRQALLRLYHHPNAQVRLTAAKATLAVAPDAARRLLRTIADSKEYPQAGDAGMSLVNLDRGIFKPT